jgi:FAD:protein FMN transferase
LHIDPAAMAGYDPAAATTVLRGAAFGTGWIVHYAGDAEPNHVRAVIEAELAAIDARMSQWAPGSTLSRFNGVDQGEWVAIEPCFATVMSAALDFAAKTGGAFDPTIGALTDLWGFGPPGPRPAPTGAAIDAARSRGGWQRLTFDRKTGRLLQPGGLALDLSGIAKGYAVDAVADALGPIGIRHALIEIGGELVGRGIRPDGEPWWVDLEQPPGASLPALRIGLHQIAVATSGNYVRGDHSIDPRTGRPPTNGVVSVSVIADTAMRADALATAATILFPDLWPLGPDLAARIVWRDGSAVREHLTPALLDML